MKLVYRLTLKPNKTVSCILSGLTYASARLFNVGNYERHEYRKLGFDKMPDWYDQKKRLKDNYWFRSLPSQTGQDILKRVDEGWKSYFTLLKTKGIENPKPPFYRKKDSHYNIRYLNNSFKVLDDGRIRFMIPRKEKEYLKEKRNIDADFFFIRLNRRISNIKIIEFRYISEEEYDVCIVYEAEDTDVRTARNGNYISIDLGICNLATVYDNKGKSFIISGNSYLNTLYYYSRRIAHYKSILSLQTKDKKAKSRRLDRLYLAMNRKIEYILHASTKRIADYCSDNNISAVIIGDIEGIREGKDIGKVGNQKLHSLPFGKLYDKLSYKLRMRGIELIYQKEFYTSSCPIDSEDISKEYQDKSLRKKRGLYKQGNVIYNADSVGAFNIMRLYRIRNNLDIDMRIEGLSNPNKISICVTG